MSTITSNQLGPDADTLFPALAARELELLQRVVNHYHKALMKQWVEDSGELVPENHVNPPYIADWPRSKIKLVIDRYLQFVERKNVRNHISVAEDVAMRAKLLVTYGIGPLSSLKYGLDMLDDVVKEPRRSIRIARRAAVSYVEPEFEAGEAEGGDWVNRD